MALTVHRESNMVKWVGVRPAHNGEQILDGKTINGLNELTCYPVGAGKILFITFLSLTASNTAAAACRSQINIYNAVPAVVCLPIVLSFQAAGRGDDSSIFCPPIELLAGWAVKLQNDNAGINSHMTLIGYLEDA